MVDQQNVYDDDAGAITGENCFVLVQTLYTEGRIDDDQRDNLKDLVLDEDAALMGLFQRYSEEPDELKRQVLIYIENPAFTQDSADVLASPKVTFGGKAPQQDEWKPEGGVDDLTSPADACLDKKKRRRFQQLHEQQKTKAEVVPVQEAGREEKVVAEPKVVPATAATFSLAPAQGAFSLSNCDIGASPVLRPAKTTLMQKNTLSPLMAATRSISQKKNGEQ